MAEQAARSSPRACGGSDPGVALKAHPVASSAICPIFPLRALHYARVVRLGSKAAELDRLLPVIGFSSHVGLVAFALVVEFSHASRAHAMELFQRSQCAGSEARVVNLSKVEETP